MKKNPFFVDVVYRVRIDENFKNTTDAFHAFDDAVTKLGRAKKYVDNIRIDSTMGGPAWNGYWYFESLDRKILAEFCSTVATIASRKGFILDV